MQLYVWSCETAFLLHLLLGLLSALSPLLCVCVSVFVCVSLFSISPSLDISVHAEVSVLSFSILILPYFSRLLISLIYSPSPDIYSHPSFLLAPWRKMRRTTSMLFYL